MSGRAKAQMQYCQHWEQQLDSNLFVTLPPILMAFGLLHPDDHPLAIQIGPAEGAEFGEPKPGGRERGEDGAMLQMAWGHKESSDIGVAEDRGELSLPPGIGKMVQHPRVPKRGVLEEAEGTDGLMKGGPGDLPVMGAIVLVSADVCRPQAVGWGVKVLRKVGDAPQVAADRIGGVVSER
jgi:hypothetical protein